MVPVSPKCSKQHQHTVWLQCSCAQQAHHTTLAAERLLQPPPPKHCHHERMAHADAHQQGADTSAVCIAPNSSLVQADQHVSPALLGRNATGIKVMTLASPADTLQQPCTRCTHAALKIFTIKQQQQQNSNTTKPVHCCTCCRGPNSTSC